MAAEMRPVVAPRSPVGFSYQTTLGGTYGEIVDGRRQAAAVASESQLFVSGLPPLKIPGMKDDYMDVVVAYPATLESAFVQLANEAKAIVTVSTRLADVYANMARDQDILINPKRGEMCAAKYPVDGNWYRACVIERPNPRQVKVFFVDYGNTEDLAKNDIKKLQDEFFTTPPQALEISLSNTTGSNFDVTKFRQLLENKTVSIKLEGSRDGSRGYMVKMHYYDAKATEYVLNDVIMGRQQPPAITPPEPTPPLVQAAPPAQQQQGSAFGGGGFGGGGGGQRSGGAGGGFGGGGGGGGGRACFNCGEEGHQSRECPQPRKPRDQQGGGGGLGGGGGFGGGGGGGGRACYNCGEEGHQSRECPQPRKPRDQQQGGGGGGFGGFGGGGGGGFGGGGGGGGRACFNCGEEGHQSRECPQPRKPRDQQQQPRSGGFGGGGNSGGGGFGGGGGNGGAFGGGGGNRGFGGGGAAPAPTGGFGASYAKPAFGGGDTNKNNNTNTIKPAEVPVQPPVIPKAPVVLTPFERAPMHWLVGKTKKAVRLTGDSPAEFYLQLDDWSAAADAITVKAGATPLTADYKGVRGVSQFDGDWFRCEVVDKTDADKTNIFYVDYGNSETKPLKEVFELAETQPAAVRTTHTLCLRCRLADVAPPDGADEWSESLSEKFAEALPDSDFDNLIDAEVVQFVKDVAVVRLPAVADKLVEAGAVAKPEPPRAPSFERADMQPFVGKTIKAFRSSAEDPHEFYVQPTDEWAALLDGLEVAAGVAPLDDAYPGCRAVSQFEGDWYRCELVQVSSADDATVFYVDYGNSETKPLKQVFALGDEQPAAVRDSHAVCFKCRLVGAAPADGASEWSAAAKSKFAELLPESDDGAVELEVVSVGDGGLVSVRVPNVADKLVEAGLAVAEAIDVLTTEPPVTPPTEIEETFVDSAQSATTESEEATTAEVVEEVVPLDETVAPVDEEVQSAPTDSEQGADGDVESAGEKTESATVADFEAALSSELELEGSSEKPDEEVCAVEKPEKAVGSAAE